MPPRLMLVRAASALAAVLLAPAFAGAQTDDVRLLAAGQSVERELAGGESHRYRLTGEAHTYVRLSFRPRGLDLDLTIQAPNGAPRAEARGIGEDVSASSRALITEDATYDVTVASPSDAASRGRYTLAVAEWRPATARDVDRVAAERALEEGDRLDRQRKAADAAGAIAKYEEALALSTSAADVPARADAYARIANIQRRLSDYPKAMEAFDRALALRREAGDRTGEASVLSEIGATFNDMGDYAGAREQFDRAVALNVGSRVLDAVILNNRGASYRRSGDARRARENYRRALPVFREIGARREIATILNNLALTSQLVGEYQEALDLYGEALPLWRALGEIENEGMTLGNLGLAHRALGDEAGALEMYQQAYALRRAAGNRIGEALTLSYLGSTYLRLGQQERAVQSLEESLAISRAIGDRAGAAVTLRDLGDVQVLAGGYARARELFQEAIVLSRAIGNVAGEAGALQAAARSWYLEGDHAKARETYLEAFPLMRASGERRREAATLLGLAQSERALGDLPSALAHVESAIEIIELMRSRVASTDLRASFQATNQEYYQLEIDLLMDLERARPAAGSAARALQVSERARSRSLLDLLMEAQVDLRQDADPALVEKERVLIARINANDTRRRQVPKGAEARLAALEKELGELLAAYREVQAQIRVRSPRYAALTQPQPLDLRQIQERVLDPDTLLLEYRLGRERSYLWAVGAESFGSFELPAEDAIDKAARRVYELMLASAERTTGGETLRQKSQRRARTRAEQARAGAALSRMVLGPVAPLLGRRRLVVVSEGALQYVPFAALPAPAADRPLIADHEVVSLPSASVLSLLRREEAAGPRGTSVAVLADPVFSADDPRLGGARAGGGTREATPAETASLDRSARESGLGGFPRLRFSRDEALAIASALPPDRVLRALDFRASRATATSPDLGRHHIVHFATHGLLNSAHPELSGIVLSLVDERGLAQDGFLRLHEIYGLDLHADLVVLSACQTALGKEIKGEGLVGLTRGFMYAGAPRVVASLWNVDDRATADLMRHFYGAMARDGMRPAQALRAAQNALRADPRWASPYYWAGFTLQGDWR